jgi:hypothetical protein
MQSRTIAGIIAAAKGKAGAWRVERELVSSEDLSHWIDVATLWHYSTPMLRWKVNDPADAAALDCGIGWGSVTDQNGMNTAFRVLDLALRFDRDARGGGPRITELTRHACGHVTDPAVEQCCTADVELRAAA